jgi:hypothetical protein
MSDETQNNKRKCMSCGFLSRKAIHPQLHGQTFFEMSEIDRESGGGNTNADLQGGAFHLHVPH